MALIVDQASVVFEGHDGSLIRALADVSLRIAPGALTVALGASGCGKTTLLNAMAGFLSLSEGSVTLDGRPILGPGPDRGVVFQKDTLFPWLSVRDNIAFGLKLQGIGRAARERRAEELLALVHLEGFAGAAPYELSGGMRQRVSLARALVADPEILLMDEPFAALDAHNKLILQEELLRIWEGSAKTVLFITHAIDEAIALGDRIVVMTAQPGRIKAIVPVDFPRPRRAAELRGDPRFGALQLSIWRMLEDEVRTARLQTEATR